MELLEVNYRKCNPKRFNKCKRCASKIENNYGICDRCVEEALISLKQNKVAERTVGLASCFVCDRVFPVFNLLISPNGPMCYSCSWIEKVYEKPCNKTEILPGDFLECENGK